MGREYSRAEQLDILADLTAMVTLALHDDRRELERYVDWIGDHDGDLRFLLRSAVILYAEAFARLGREQGFDPCAVTHGIALRESRERWGDANA
jgi:hypothetical protein